MNTISLAALDTTRVAAIQTAQLVLNVIMPTAAFTVFAPTPIFNATASSHSSEHMLFTKHNNRHSTPRWLAYFLRVVALGLPAFVLLSFLCRPTFAAVSVSPELVMLSGDQTVRVSARVNTHLPVEVDLVELQHPPGSSLQRQQPSISNAVTRLTRQSDGSFAATFDLNQHQPGIRYFTVAAHYVFFLPVWQPHDADLEVDVTQHPTIVTIPEHEDSSTAGSDGSTLPPENGEYLRPLHKTASGNVVGTGTVTGYLQIQYTPCSSELGRSGGTGVGVCLANPYYAFFDFSKSDSLLLEQYLAEANQHPNSLYDPTIHAHMIGLGCYQPSEQQIMSTNRDAYGNYLNVLTGTFLSQLLRSNAAHPVNLKVELAPFVLDGADDPACAATFKALKISS